MGYINNDVAVTRGGNAIVKSNGGTKVGTAVGVTTAATSAALLAMPMDTFVKNSSPAFISKISSCVKICRTAIKNFINGSATKYSISALKNMSKAGRVGVVATALTAALATPIVVCRGLGKLIDKARDNNCARKVDNWTIAQKLN